jgi:hypothetical protein
MDELTKCQSCGKDVDGELHPCPYAEEINNDDTPCNCCDDCAQECAWDI